MNVAALLTLGLVPVPASDEPAKQSLDELNKEFTKELGTRAISAELAAEMLRFIPGSGSVGISASVAIAMAKAVGPAMFTALGVWLQARYGRKVRLKVGDIEAEARTKEEVQQLIARAQEIQERKEPKRIHEP